MANNVSLNKWTKFEANIEYQPIVDKFGKDTSSYLKRTSPRGHRRSKTYAQGWEFKIDDKRVNSYGGKVWNATNYQLTHLLENGHLIVNKIGGVGWASARPHIDEAYRRVKDPFIRAMEKVDIDVNLK